MKQEFKKYLKEIGIEGELLTKIEEIIRFYKSIYSEFEPDTLFITDYVNPDGSRIYENMWLINEDFVAEAKNFNNENHFDLMNMMHRKVNYWEIKSKEFDPSKKSTVSSRLNITVKFDDDMGTIFKASSNNCDHLLKLFEKYYRAKFLK